VALNTHVKMELGKEKWKFSYHFTYIYVFSLVLFVYELYSVLDKCVTSVSRQYEENVLRTEMYQRDFYVRCIYSEISI
jgi:hypothetical protein